MKQVVVIGCPGAGKTTFSRELARITGLPLIHLDYYYHDKTKSYQDDKKSWQNLVKSLVSKNEWIIDGNYKSTFEYRSPRADTIIYFDFPRRITLWRTFKRRLEYRNSVRADMPETWKEKIDLEFLKFIWSFNKTQRPGIYELLARHSDKDILIFTSPRQVTDYLNSLGLT